MLDALGYMRTSIRRVLTRKRLRNERSKTKSCPRNVETEEKGSRFLRGEGKRRERKKETSATGLEPVRANPIDEIDEIHSSLSP